MKDFLIFIGAGGSVPLGIPTMTGLVKAFEEKLDKKPSALRDFYEDLKNRLVNYQGYDIEALITVLQDVIALDQVPTNVLCQPSIHYFSKGSINQIFERDLKQLKRNQPRAIRLLTEVKRFIAQCCVIRERKFDIYDGFFGSVLTRKGFVFQEAIKTGGHLGKECTIFTTNYDQVLEAYWKSRGFNYECGQKQNEILDISYKNRELFSSSGYPKILKLHGSINWYVDQYKNMRWMTEAAESGKRTLMGDEVARELLIYPVHEKYTFREPFYAMFHYLKEYLLHANRCYVVGYSFRDEDILGIFHDAMQLNNNLVLVLVDPEAPRIAGYKFHQFGGRVNAIPLEMSTDANNELASTA